jgi:hypothetical protein
MRRTPCPNDSEVSEMWTLRFPSALAMMASLAFGMVVEAAEPAPIDIGSRRELFVDELLIGELNGTRLKLHEPQRLPRNAYPARPTGHYATVIKDGDLYRLYYRGDKIPGAHWREGWMRYHDQEVTLYAESRDGYHWTKPELKLYKLAEFPDGNVVLDEGLVVNHNFSPFIDERPGVPADQRYKGLGGLTYPLGNWPGWKTPGERDEVIAQHGPSGLRAFVSPDGIHWTKLQEEPVITSGAFDSQNVAFWSPAEQQYACYYRLMNNGVRSIARVTSADFLHWTEPVVMQANQPGEHLYTNGTHPYFRAPHIYLALPTRFMANRSGITDVVLMAARPGSTTYTRLFQEAFIRPGLGPDGWGNRSNYIAWHVVPTSDTEMSMYNVNGDHLVLRIDGFISIEAGAAEGEFITKPFTFQGSQLEVNESTSAAGRIRVEIQDADGKPIEGYALEDSETIYGDRIRHVVRWGAEQARSADVSRLAGRPIRLRFVMQEASLYSLKFDKAD